MIDGAAVNVLDYGATGDGVTNDSSAIQSALNVGGTVYFPSGLYSVGTTLNVPANTEVILAEDATLKAAVGLTGPILYVNAVSNVKVTGGTIDGNGSVASLSTYGIHVYDSSYVNISNCVVKNAKSVNVRIEGPSSGSVSSDISVTNCEITGSLGVGFTPTYSSYVLFSNNKVINNVTGFTSGEVFNMNIVGNTFHNNANDGCAVGNNCSYVTVVGNTSSYNGAEGINIDGVNHGVIVGNTSVANLIGIAVWNRSPGTPLAGRNVVSGNSISTCTQYGIVLADSQNNCVIEANSINACGYEGIYVNECSYGVIANNTVNENALHGISLVGGIGVKIDSNYCSENGGNGVFVSAGTGVGRVTISNNTLKGNSTYGIYDQSNGSENVINGNIFNDEKGSPTQTNTIYVKDNAVKITNNIAQLVSSPYPVFFSGSTAYQSSNTWQLSSSTPSAGTWHVGDIVYNTAPASAGYIGWVCTVAGSPGTWKTFGLIS